MSKHSQRLLSCLYLATSLITFAGCDPQSSEGPHAQLTRIDDVGPGTDCKDGGRAIRSGSDTNDNGVLDDDEIVSSEYVCKEHVDEPSRDLLSDRQPEPAGAHCEFGGTVIRSGLDTNHDSVLDGNEVTSTVYVCDDAPVMPAPRTLVRVEVEPAGGNCVAGGAVILTGSDLDGDGVLAASEVQFTQYECDSAFVGDYVIDSQAAVDALAGIRVITGKLTLTVDLVAQVKLPLLRHVGGDLVANDTIGLESLSVPALTSVGGDIDFNDSYLSSLELSALTSVGGHLRIMLGHLPAPAFPALEDVGGDLSISTGATIVAWPALREVAGPITCYGMPESVSLPALVRAGAVEILDASHLGHFEATSLAVVDGEISLIGYNGESLAFPALQIIGGSAYFAHGTALADVQLPELQSVGGTIVFADMQKLRHLVLPKLASVGKLVVRDQPVLTTISLPLLTSVPDELGLWSNAQLDTIDAPALADVGTLSLQENAALSGLAGLGRLETIHQSLYVYTNPSLHDLTGLVRLHSITDYMMIVGNDTMVSVGVPNLSYVFAIWIGRGYGNAALAVVDLPALTQVEGITIDSNPVLTDLKMSLLRRANGFWITLNPMLSHCIPAVLLAQLGGTPTDVHINHNDETTTCDMP